MTQLVAIALVEFNGRYAILQRASGDWVFPGGKVDPGEKPVNAATRETHEETGLDATIVADLGTQEKNNQLRHYFLCKANSSDIRINEPDKFKFAGWKTPDEIMTLIGHRIASNISQHFSKLEIC